MKADTTKKYDQTLVDARQVLEKHWGYSDFRPAQKSVVAAAVEKRDVLAILPTGGGKSICFQVPALLTGGLTVVISPLIALMDDQVAGLKARGISAGVINSTLSRRDSEQFWIDAEFGKYKFIYLAPERLSSPHFLGCAARLNVQFLVIDEAHCVSEWGHHFRPAYLQIPEAREILGNPPMMAVTATATPEVRQDMLKHLALVDPVVAVNGFDRPNLDWSVLRPESKRKKVKEIIEQTPGSGIIYAATRRHVENWAKTLNRMGISAGYYHGGRPSAERQKVMNDWMAGEPRMMVATNAFGMGIDKSDVRFVIHVDLPGNIEAYYQEAGRGGRDGERAKAILIYHPKDSEIQQSLITEGYATTKQMQAVYQAICNLAQLAIGSLPDHPITVKPKLVAKMTGLSTVKIKNAIQILERQEVWQSVRANPHFGWIRFHQTVSGMRNYMASLKNADLSAFVDQVIRLMPAEAFQEWTKFRLQRVFAKSNLPDSRFLKGLDYLQGQNVLSWIPPAEALTLDFNFPRVAKVSVSDTAILAAQSRAQKRLESMIQYAESITCRHRFLMLYFGESTIESNCGSCDVCLGQLNVIEITPDDELFLHALLRQISAGMNKEKWFPNDRISSKQLQAWLTWLINDGYIKLEDPLTATFKITSKGQGFIN